MIRLDPQLLAEARRIIDGANVHRLKQMIFAYEQAVDLHNRHWTGHEIYHIEIEARLRMYVCRQQDEAIQRRTLVAIKTAAEASNKSIALAHESDRLGQKVNEWTHSRTY